MCRSGRNGTSAPIDRLPAEVGGLRDLDHVGALAQHVLHRGQLRAGIARLTPAVGLAIGLGVLDAGALRFLRSLGLRLSMAAIKPISASRTAICIGSLVVPSNTMPLMTVRTMTPRRMNSRIAAVTNLASVEGPYTETHDPPAGLCADKFGGVTTVGIGCTKKNYRWGGVPWHG